MRRFGIRPSRIFFRSTGSRWSRSIFPPPASYPCCSWPFSLYSKREVLRSVDFASRCAISSTLPNAWATTKKVAAPLQFLSGCSARPSLWSNSRTAQSFQGCGKRTSTTSCSARSAWLPRSASSRRRRWCPSGCSDFAIARKVIETLHSAWNKISSRNGATAIDRQTDSHRRVSYFRQ